MSLTSFRGPIGSPWGVGYPPAGIGGLSPPPRCFVLWPDGCISDQRSHGGLSRHVSSPGYTVGVIHRITQESEGGVSPYTMGRSGGKRKKGSYAREGGEVTCGSPLFQVRGHARPVVLLLSARVVSLPLSPPHCLHRIRRSLGEWMSVGLY